MALVIAGICIASAFVGGLVTYSTTKALEDRPTHESVHALINNQITEKINQNDEDKFFTNMMIFITFIMSLLLCVYLLMKCIVSIITKRANANANANANQIQV